MQKFDLGRLVATPAALEFMEANVIPPLSLIARHASGDWGDLDEEDKEENEFSLENGFRILSSYKFDAGDVWVITEADRSATTLLLPSDY